MNASRPLFEVDELRTKHVGPLSLALARGESLVLSGPSGTGKSLLLRAMADLDPHEGRVLLDGREQSEYPVTEWRHQVAYLPAESAWWADTVGEHFNNPQSIAWKKLGFETVVSDWNISRLSSGERQRLALLRMLENQPRVLLLDEPTANLDAENTALVESLVADYRDHYEAVIVWVSHDRAQLERLQARVIELNKPEKPRGDHDE